MVFASLNADEIIAKASSFQKQDFQSLDHTLAIISDTMAVGRDTALSLQQQTEQLSRIMDSVDSVDSNLVLISKHFRVFLRRMATDKLIMALLLLVLCGIIIAIVVSII